MLRDELRENKKLRNYLISKNYTNLMGILNTLYKSNNDIEVFELLYNVYSPFSKETKPILNDYKTIVAKFYDYVMFNHNYFDIEFDVDDVVMLLSYLEKRRLIYGLDYSKVEILNQQYGLYLHIILSFVASFKN